MSMTTPPHHDQDEQKGTVEGNHPDDQLPGNPHGGGVDGEGLPDDPIATAEDEIGANVDGSQG